MVILKTTATLGALIDSQPQLDDHYTDDPFFTQVIWEVSGNKIKWTIKPNLSYKQVLTINKY